MHEGRVCRVGRLVRLIFFHRAVAADGARLLTSRAHAARVLSDEGVAVLALLFRQVLDVFEPGEHRVVGFCAEDPGMATMHGACLTALEHELVR